MIAVLAGNTYYLRRLYEYREPLADIRFILVLPSTEKDCRCEAVSLYPIYMTGVESDFIDIRQVLCKLLRKYRRV